ncbi:MAG TPA: hypothetical protein VGE74_18485 [Gemmata sp.]
MPDGPGRREPPHRRALLALEAVEPREVPATVSGVAWFDTNANGALDPGEGAAAGVGVLLTSMGGSSMATTSGYPLPTTAPAPSTCGTVRS